MLSIPAGVRIYLALEPCDMRRGFDGLALLVQQALGKDPFTGHLYIFRGKGAGRLKILYADQNGLCLFAKRLEKGRFVSYDLCQELKTQRPVAAE
ncbi:MAG TPA: IS66 family insertion sequence element accessory protein TnpB [Azospirillum sp.]|nr:IS66 family insertion sequence element accessory protein TnpB [Azospirillum sp.]